MERVAADSVANSLGTDWGVAATEAPLVQSAGRQEAKLQSAGGRALPDVQSTIDHRGLRVDAVGIKDIRYPMNVRSGGSTTPTVATLTMTVGLSATSKGTHMSRFVEMLEEQSQALSLEDFRTLIPAMLRKLDARSGEVEMRFPYFIRKAAPVSGVQSLLDYEVSWTGRCDGNPDNVALRMKVSVPATSLCPCSKEISAYGAHNQRSCISIDAEVSEAIPIQDLVRMAERGASCEVYGLLKRQDEKFVTEHAYDNPKFVEDLVRDVALALDVDPRVKAFVVEAENFESIHNHSAFARISRGRMSS